MLQGFSDYSCRFRCGCLSVSGHLFKVEQYSLRQSSWTNMLFSIQIGLFKD